MLNLDLHWLHYQNYPHYIPTVPTLVLGFDRVDAFSVVEYLHMCFFKLDLIRLLAMYAT